MEEGSESMVRYVEEGIIVCVFAFVSCVYTSSCLYLIFYFNFNLIKKYNRQRFFKSGLN
jgi:hypothetical protein